MSQQHLRDLPSEALNRLEVAVRAFEDAWQKGQRPAIDAFLRVGPGERRAVLIEFIHVDLECRLRAGRPVRVEHYLKKYPELKSEPALVVDLLVKELRFRRAREPKLSVDEYLRRFPSLQDALKARMEAEAETVVGVAEASTSAPQVATPQRSCSIDELLQRLLQLPLLSAPQRQELAGVRDQFADADALAAELVRRSWLTAHQSQVLLQGRGSALVIGPYVVLDRLGEGGMGQVFKARHQVMKRLVAVKVIRKGILSYGEQVQRFYREIEAVARLSHPNIVLAHDAGLVGDVHFFAMEYVEGVDLARRLRDQGPVPVDKACDYVRQAALGLQHAHERGLVHRDIKPSNLLLCRGEDGHDLIKILDLGLARIHAAANKARLTQVGEVMGTADYIAPEQATDASQVDIRADIYSLGCTLYHLIAGQPVFTGGSMVDKLRRHQKDEPRPLGKIRTLPPGLDEMVAKLLAKQPEDRCQTPRDVAEALVPFCPPSTNQAASTTASITGLRPVAAWSRRRLLIGAAVVAAAAILTAVLIPLLRHGPIGGDPKAIATGEPMSLHALVGQPAQLPGVKSWTVETTGHRGVIADVKASPDGKLLASAGHDGTVRLWNVEEDFKLERVFIGLEAWQSVAWSPDGKRLATLSLRDSLTKCHVAIWEVATGICKLFVQPEGTGDGLSIAWAPDSQSLVLSLYFGDTVLIGADGTIMHQGIKLGRECAFRPDGKALAAIAKNRLRFFNRSDFKQVQAFDLPMELKVDEINGVPRPRYASWSPTGDRLALVSEQFFWVLDAATGNVLVKNDQPAQKGRRQQVAWSRDGKRCAVSVGDLPGYATCYELLDAGTGKVEHATEAMFSRACKALAWAQDDKLLVAATDGHSHIVGGATALHVFAVHGADPDKQPSHTFGGSAPREVLPWLAYGTNGELFPISQEGKRIVSGHGWLRSPDGKWTAYGQGDAIALWDVAANRASEPIKASEVLSNPVLAWSQDSKFLACAAQQNPPRLFDVGARKEVNVFTNAEVKQHGFSVALAPDNKTLAVVAGHQIIWLDVASQKIKRNLFHFGYARVAYSPDGQLFAAATSGRVTVWDASAVVEKENADPLASWPTPGPNFALAFSPDGKTLATAGNNGPFAYFPAVVRFWDPRTGRPLGCVHALEGDMGLAVSAEGHVRVTGVNPKRAVVYVIETERGQETLSFDAFAQRFGWANDAEQTKR